MNRDLEKLVLTVEKLSTAIGRLHSRRPSDESSVFHDDVFT